MRGGTVPRAGGAPVPAQQGQGQAPPPRNDQYYPQQQSETRPVGNADKEALRRERESFEQEKRDALRQERDTLEQEKRDFAKQKEKDALRRERDAFTQEKRDFEEQKKTMGTEDMLPRAAAAAAIDKDWW